MADSLLPNHSTQSIIVNSRVLQRQLQSQNYPKFLENFEEIPLKDRKEEINRKMEKSDFRTDESNLKTKDINLSNLQINQSFDNNRNAGYMRSSIQKKKIFDENYLSSSKLNGLGSNYQNYKKQRTFSTQIYDNTQTENSFTQVNQSLNYQSFNQNRMHLLSFQDDDMIIQPNNQQEKDSQMKLIQDILSQFKKEITKDQSNAFDQLRYFVNSNEQKINEIQDMQQKRANQKVPQLTLSRLNQLAQIKTDIIQKISQQISTQIDERFTKIEDNQNTLYNYNKKIKQDLITFFNESVSNLLENTYKKDIQTKIDQFQINIQEKIASIESKQSEILNQQNEEESLVSIDIEKREKECTNIQSKLDKIKVGMDDILEQLDQKADIQTLQIQFNSTFNDSIHQINQDIKQINDIRQEQNQIESNINQRFNQNFNRLETLELQTEQKLSSFEEQHINSQEQFENNKSKNFIDYLDKLSEKIKQLNEMHLKLQATQQIYDEKIKLQEKIQEQQMLNKEMTQEIINLEDSIATGNDFDHFITMTIDDDKRQLTSAKGQNPYRKSTKIQDSQLTQKDLQESNLFRYSTIIQNDNINKLEEIQDIISKGQIINSKPPKQQSKIVFRRKRLSESKVESYENEQSYLEQKDQVNEFPCQEYLTLKNVIPCKIVTSLQPSPQAVQKDLGSNSQQQSLNSTNQFSNIQNKFRSSLDNFTSSSSNQRLFNQDNTSPRQQQNTQPISLSQYYKLSIIRKSCDFGSYSKNQNYSQSQEKILSNYNSGNKITKFNYDDQFSSNQRVNTVPSLPEQNSINEGESYSQTLEKRCNTTDIKQEYLDASIYLSNYNKNISKMPIKFPKPVCKTPTLIGVDTPQEAKSDLKKRIIEQKQKKEGTKYLIPSINLNNLMKRIQQQ